MSCFCWSSKRKKTGRHAERRAEMGDHVAPEKDGKSGYFFVPGSWDIGIGFYDILPMSFQQISFAQVSLSEFYSWQSNNS